jgi:hypothetical protein
MCNQIIITPCVNCVQLHYQTFSLLFQWLQQVNDSIEVEWGIDLWTHISLITMMCE